MKETRKNPIFIGNSITNFISASINTLVVDFVLSTGKEVFQIQNFFITFLAVVMSIIIGKNKTLKERVYNNFRSFMLIEAVINIILGVLTLIVGSPMIYVVSSILLVPFSKIQKLGIIRLMSEKIKNREEFDMLTELASPYIIVSGYGVGFLLNYLIDGPMSFFVLCIAEVINNLFYLKAYNEN